jgi:dCTP diphosphatase
VTCWQRLTTLRAAQSEVAEAISLLTPFVQRDREINWLSACYVDLMADKSLHDELQAFVAERDWAQFHSPANLAKSISIEAAELLECFQWSDEADETRVREELADVLTYCLLLADRIGVDPDQIVREKLALTREKYPADKARGRSAKYDAL